MKEKWKSLLVALAIPLAVGGLGALLSGGMSDYGAMRRCIRAFWGTAIW